MSPAEIKNIKRNTILKKFLLQISTAMRIVFQKFCFPIKIGFFPPKQEKYRMAIQSTLLNESLEVITENGSRNKPERHLRTEFDRQCEAKKREKQRCPNLLNSTELSSNFQVNTISIQCQNPHELLSHLRVSESLKLYLKKTINHFPSLLPIHKHQFYIQLQ